MLNLLNTVTVLKIGRQLVKINQQSKNDQSMKHAILLCTLLISCFSFGQNNAQSDVSPKIGTINGIVIDQSLEQPIPYATVAITLNQEVVQGGITKEDGSFQLSNVGEGVYTLEVQFIGYQTYQKSITITAKDPNANLGTISLVDNITELEGVDVVAERSTIEQKID